MSIIIASENYNRVFEAYRTQEQPTPLLFLGDAFVVVQEIPDSSIDCVLTSPPYWGKRAYPHGSIGQEKKYCDYVSRIASFAREIKRVLKPTGSFWLNIGDGYHRKNLIGIPWRIAFELTDTQGWILRNAVVWNKVKGGMDSTRDRLGNGYEMVFHFVKQRRNYYYNIDAIRAKPRSPIVENGRVRSATGVSGVRYRRAIEHSPNLSEHEKAVAYDALEKILADVAAGRLFDFRMIIRGNQRPTHSDNETVSGRAKELRENGFYFLRYHPNGSKPRDVWDILPEDTHGRTEHFAPYPIDLCRIPILATCPENGIVLDPFCGTGTTLVATQIFGRKSVGIDSSRTYLEQAKARCESIHQRG